MAKVKFGKMRGPLRNLSLKMQLRLRILKRYILPGLFHRCNSWTIKSDMKKKMEAVEIWFLRRLLRVL